MKITKRQLKRIIKEEKAKILKEYGSMSQAEHIENKLVSFTIVYGALGEAIQQQVNALILVQEDVGIDTEEFVDAVMQSNPHAIREAYGKLQSPLEMMANYLYDAKSLLETLEAAIDIISRDGEY